MDLIRFARALRARGFRYRGRPRKGIAIFVLERLIGDRAAYASVLIDLRHIDRSEMTLDRMADYWFERANHRLQQMEAR